MALPPDLQFYFMHFMPYADLPEDHEKYESTWVDFPNKFYDPVKGKKFYERYFAEMVLADRVGFDGLVVNEHHSSPYNMMQSATMVASALVPVTSRAKICVFGTPINLQYPNRVAEEYALLDVMSGGRTEFAFPLGTGMEYWSNATMLTPATARARFREGIDVILQAWEQEGPSTFDGEFYSYRYLNSWPTTYQKPRPKCYIVGTGSPQTIELAAELGFGYSVVFIPIQAQLKTFEAYRAKTQQLGRTAAADDVCIMVMAYVADTDEEALAEGKEHILYYFDNMMRVPPRFLIPPGYVTNEEFRKRAAAANVHGTADWDTLTANSRVVCGSPETVAKAIEGWVEEAGTSRVICNLHLGDMPHWKTVKNLTLFAEEVIPRLRKAGVSGNGAGRPAAVSAAAS
ncbi:MAG TPA: LLM class flavin-dependent oxidoreductase [Acidimicrobiales bacterium]|nr:LLM class flavin-dependent oxidoreductase [Acidimicrobiales bacterium]